MCFTYLEQKKRCRFAKMYNKVLPPMGNRLIQLTPEERKGEIFLIKMDKHVNIEKTKHYVALCNDTGNCVQATFLFIFNPRCIRNVDHFHSIQCSVIFLGQINHSTIWTRNRL